MLLMEPPTRADTPEHAGETTVSGAAWLPARLDALAARFALPTVAASSLPLQAEVVALAQAGMAECALLACIVACVSRHADTGPAVAHGPWADSALLAFCGAVVVPPGATAAEEVIIAADAHADFLTSQQGATRVGPLLLLPEAPGAALLDAIAAEALRFDLAIRAEARGGMTCLFAADAPAGARGAPVTLGVSRLWWGVCLAARLLDEHHGYRCHPLTPIVMDEDRVLARLSAPWARVLPETPSWLCEERSAPDRLAWERLWRNGAGGGVTGPARAALRARAALVWHFASLAALDPALGWSALAAVVEPAHRPAVLAAARQDGGDVPVAPRGEFEPDAAGATPGLASAIPAPSAAAATSREIGRRAFRYGEQELQVLALAVNRGSDEGERAEAGDTHAHQADGVDGPGDATAGAPLPRLLLVGRDMRDADKDDSAALPTPVPGCSSVSVSAELARLLAASTVVVRVPLTGERERDMDLVNNVVSLLRTHEGPQTVRVILERGEARRTLDRLRASGVLWSSALAAALTDLLGPGHAVLDPLAAFTPGR